MNSYYGYLDNGKPDESQGRKAKGTTVYMHNVSQLPKDKAVLPACLSRKARNARIPAAFRLQHIIRGGSMINKNCEITPVPELELHLSDILGEELSQQLQSTMRQASARELIDLRDSLQVMSQWLKEHETEQHITA